MKSDIATLPIDMDVRLRGTLLEAACKRIDAAPVRGAAIAQEVQYLASQGVSMSKKRLEATYYDWRKRGAIACIDKRKVFGQTSGRGVHHPAFKAFWIGLAAQASISSKTAYEELLRRWRAGEPIPGYETAWKRDTIPAGWSYENLMRLLPSKTELAIYRRGMVQAHDILPQVLSTREGSYPMQFCFFDDVWVDRLSRHGAEINRCMQLGCLDFCTGKRLVWGTKFRHRRKDGSHVYFDKDDMLLEVCDLLMNVGYNAQKGTTLVVENGTACISREAEELLAALTGGMVRVDRSGMVGTRQLLRGYEGGAKGNPDHKAHLESWHNVFHNRLCFDSPGWAGKDRTPPETVYGIIKAEKAHIRNLADLPINRAMMSVGHLPTFYELCDEIGQVVMQLNNRTDHRLEGWERCGFVKHECRLGDHWEDTEALCARTPELRPIIAELPLSAVRTRNMSPAEAWEAAISLPGNELTRFTPVQCAQLLALCKGLHIRQPLSCTRAHFSWRDKSGWLQGEELLYETTYTDLAGWQRSIAYDAKGITGVVNPFDPEHLFLFDANNCLLGVSRQIVRVHRDDVEAVRAAMGRKAQRTGRRLEYMQDILSPYEQEVMAKKEWNARVADYNEGTGQSAPLTIAEVVEQREDKASMAAALRMAAHQPTVGQFTLPDPAEEGLPQQYAPSSFNL